MNLEAAKARLMARLAKDITNERVLEAMGRVPRERFVPAESIHLAYDDSPLPIGLDQTISQPYIVALMTQGLELRGDERVLEIGTGSGYQTAVLAELSGLVVSTERLPILAERAGSVLARLGYGNVDLRSAGETLGWRGGAPYDAILATAAAPQIPDELLSQLAIGGRMIIPVGSRHIQELRKITRLPGRLKVENLGACRFVSLIGKSAWPEEQRAG